MKQIMALALFAVIFGLIITTPGCGSSGGGSSRSGSTSYGGGGGTGTGTGGGGNTGGTSGGDTTNDANTGMFTAQDMFNHINKLRGEYTSHGPYDGYPWKGQNADSMTWSITMTADSGLAGEAQAEAERVRDGGDPAGERFGYQNGGGEPFWATGIDTPKYMITGWSTDQLDGNLYGRWHTKANGTFRLGCAYQSGSGQYNKKHLLGVGKADVQDKNEIWWVLIFGE